MVITDVGGGGGTEYSIKVRRDKGSYPLEFLQIECLKCISRLFEDKNIKTNYFNA